MDDLPSRIISTPIAMKHDIYMYDIGEPEEFQDAYQLIRQASPDDYIAIHLNSHGGHAHTAIQFYNTLRNSDATTVGCFEGVCASAATIVALGCNSWELNPHIECMIHNYSAGVEGKGHELLASVEFSKRWSDNLIRTVYKHFLTAKEIEEVINGKDYWFTADEVKVRLERVAKARSKDAQGIAI